MLDIEYNFQKKIDLGNIHIKGQKNGINSHLDFWAIEYSIYKDFNWAN